MGMASPLWSLSLPIGGASPFSSVSVRSEKKMEKKEGNGRNGAGAGPRESAVGRGPQKGWAQPPKAMSLGVSLRPQLAILPPPLPLYRSVNDKLVPRACPSWASANLLGARLAAVRER